MQRSRLNRALCLAVGGLALSTAVASANTTLFTTGSDWTGWTGAANRTSVAVSAASFDSNTTNGAGNNPGNAGSSINAGATDVNGSLQITPTAPLGFGIIASAPGEAYNPSFMAAIDPGSTAAYTAATNYGPGNTVAYSGNLLVSYTMPDLSASSNPYFQIGVLLAYDGDNGYATFFSSGTTTATVNGATVYTATVPYNIVAGSLSYLGFSLMSNASGDVTPGAFTVDDLEVVNSSSTPEPTSLALLSVGGLALLKRRRV